MSGGHARGPLDGEAGVAFQLLEYDYDPSADAIGLQAAQALGRSSSTVFKTLIVALDSGELVCAIIPSDTLCTENLIRVDDAMESPKLAE